MTGKAIWKEIFEWVISIALAFVIAFLLRQFVFTLVEVKGDSMDDTLQNANKLFIWRLGYTPHDGDIIVLQPPNDTDLYIKRVIATGGQTVNIDYSQHAVYVDGKLLDEPYIKDKDMVRESSGEMTFPQTVPQNSVFVMGDNRNNSKDSRFPEVGMIADNKILGKAILRVWPFSEFGGLYGNMNGQ